METSPRATYASGWCNIPDKNNPTEQMIVAYHQGMAVHAYKGVFNYNLNHDWIGGVVVDFKKTIDQCTKFGIVQLSVQPCSTIL